MNDAVPVVAAPPARDHAPPDRGQEPAPSDAFAAALGAAQPAEAPPPAADPTARTAPAEGTKAEGDSSGPDTRKTADAGAPAVAAAALVISVPAVAVAPEAGPAAPASAVAAQAAAGPVAAAQPKAAPQAPAATPPTGSGEPETASPAPTPQAAAPAAEAPSPAAAAVPAPVPSAEAPPSASVAAPVERPAGGEKPAPAAGTGLPEPVAEASAAAAEDAPGQSVSAVRATHRPAASRAGRSQDAPVRSGRGASPAAATHAAPRAERTHDVPAAHGAGTSADAPSARPNDVPAAAHVPTDTEMPAVSRADQAPAIQRAVPDQARQDAGPRVRVHDVPDITRATLRVAVRGNGTATARISLHPADLGGVRITMRVHDGAVAATLTAETEAAAQALVQTASDLRRSLEGQGLQITSLDVHVAGDGPASSGDRRQASDLAQAMSTTDGTASEDAVDITTELLHLVPLGTQVDVLA
jgi:flagellar hook-length control protein FliK